MQNIEIHTYDWLMDEALNRVKALKKSRKPNPWQIILRYYCDEHMDVIIALNNKPECHYQILGSTYSEMNAFRPSS